MFFARIWLAVAELLLCHAVEWTHWFATKRHERRDGQARDKGSAPILTAVGWVVIIVAFILAGARPIPFDIELGGTGTQIASAVLVVLGVYVRMWSIHTLGSFFTREVKVSADQPVIDVGPYRLVRHPSYTGYLLSTFGIALAMNTLASFLILTLPQVIGIAYRVRVEEQALAENIGPRYREYMARTKRFIPFLV